MTQYFGFERLVLRALAIILRHVRAETIPEHYAISNAAEEWIKDAHEDH